MMSKCNMLTHAEALLSVLKHDLAVPVGAFPPKKKNASSDQKLQRPTGNLMQPTESD